MKEYTTEIHAQRVRAVITGEHPSRHCPAVENFEPFHFRYKLGQLKIISRNPASCKICRTFVSITVEHAVCPCDYYGEIDAVKRTWVALKEYHKE